MGKHHGGKHGFKVAGEEPKQGEYIVYRLLDMHYKARYFYVGSTKNFPTRMYQHWSCDGGSESARYLFKRVGGKKNIIIEIESKHSTEQEMRDAERQVMNNSPYAINHKDKVYCKHFAKNMHRIPRTIQQILDEDCEYGKDYSMDWLGFVHKVARNSDEPYSWSVSYFDKKTERELMRLPVEKRPIKFRSTEQSVYELQGIRWKEGKEFSEFEVISIYPEPQEKDCHECDNRRVQYLCDDCWAPCMYCRAEEFDSTAESTSESTSETLSESSLELVEQISDNEIQLLTESDILTPIRPAMPSFDPLIKENSELRSLLHQRDIEIATLKTQLDIIRKVLTV